MAVAVVVGARIPLSPLQLYASKAVGGRVCPYHSPFYISPSVCTGTFPARMRLQPPFSMRMPSCHSLLSLLLRLGRLI